MCEAADQSLAHITGLLHSEIVANAPASERYGPLPKRSWSLNNAELSVEPSRLAEVRPEIGPYDSLFEIVSYASITLRIPRDQHGYEGRSHSLWYCDAQESGVFRWYETAFMINPLVPKRGRLDPFSLSPGKDAYLALSPAMHTYQVAWPFTPIDQGDESEFIERWIGWFAEAAQAQFRHPSHIPERDTFGSWRRAG